MAVLHYEFLLQLPGHITAKSNTYPFLTQLGNCGFKGCCFHPILICRQCTLTRSSVFEEDKENRMTRSLAGWFQSIRFCPIDPHAPVLTVQAVTRKDIRNQCGGCCRSPAVTSWISISRQMGIITEQAAHSLGQAVSPGVCRAAPSQVGTIEPQVVMVILQSLSCCLVAE